MNADLTNVEVLPDDFSQYDLSFKLIVVGDSGVGKSCLTLKATKNIFEDNYNATVGFEFCTFNVKMDGKVIKLQIWDTCGQETYRSLITNFYKNSSLAFMVYAINDAESFENIDVWLKELRTNSNPDVKVFLIGNKSDLENSRKVDKNNAIMFKDENRLNYFTETSAKTGLNSKEVFIEAARVLYKDYLVYKEKAGSRPNSTASIDSFGNRFSSNNRLSSQKLSKDQQAKPAATEGKSGCKC